eukprot:CAMPEP_0194345816 /NCGR_PEP_ID=MMETSP0171-20130528/105067_1 /TAXON_ID=218684 /ORGANISM="Corethron pennatum, Strain L29A3" /LENGTH=417 /DNA_ID=CAMNT_0039112843 /DNA_START=39 /DNA_END=1293 /DNA_ORIENTATION=-
MITPRPPEDPNVSTTNNELQACELECTETKNIVRALSNYRGIEEKLKREIRARRKAEAAAVLQAAAFAQSAKAQAGQLAALAAEVGDLRAACARQVTIVAAQRERIEAYERERDDVPRLTALGLAACSQRVRSLSPGSPVRKAVMPAPRPPSPPAHTPRHAHGCYERWTCGARPAPHLEHSRVLQWVPPPPPATTVTPVRHTGADGPASGDSRSPTPVPDTAGEAAAPATPPTDTRNFSNIFFFQILARQHLVQSSCPAADPGRAVAAAFPDASSVCKTPPAAAPATPPTDTRKDAAPATPPTDTLKDYFNKPPRPSARCTDLRLILPLPSLRSETEETEDPDERARERRAPRPQPATPPADTRLEALMTQLTKKIDGLEHRMSSEEEERERAAKSGHGRYFRKRHRKKTVTPLRHY